MNASVLISPVYDLDGGLVLMVLGGYALVLLLGIVILEAIILWFMRWGTFFQSLLDSFIVNLVTTILGIMYYFWFSFSTAEDYAPAHMGIMWILTTILEGAILLNIRLRPALKTWVVSFVTNSVSYFFLFLIIHGRVDVQSPQYTQNATIAPQGERWTRPADGMVMVYVPGGTFEMGSTEDEIEALFSQCLRDYGNKKCRSRLYSVEYPQHTVTLDSFWIDQNEVTVAQYKLCLEAGPCYIMEGGEDDHPVRGVSWSTANDYCNWVGARLPTEAEWEYAARGEQGYIYPWGNTFDCQHGNFVDAGCDLYPRIMPVGSFPSGASWCGALDMTGSVPEWVADWYGDYSSEAQLNPTGPSVGLFQNTNQLYKVVRGGNATHLPYYYRATSREQAKDRSISPLDIGFRCAGGSR